MNAKLGGLTRISLRGLLPRTTSINLFFQGTKCGRAKQSRPRGRMVSDHANVTAAMATLGTAKEGQGLPPGSTLPTHPRLPGREEDYHCPGPSRPQKGQELNLKGVGEGPSTFLLDNF